MEILTVGLGRAIEDGNYPARMVLADIYDGVATILRVNHPEEDLDTLIRQVPHIQRMNAAKRRRRLSHIKDERTLE